MLLTNGNCQLPCWLGITPGKTHWDEAYSFLITFADHINSSIYYDFHLYGVIFKLPEGSPHDLSYGATLFVQNNTVVTILYAPNINLSDLLRTYGMPSQVIIRVIGFDTMDPVGRFTLALFYPDKGILAIYTGQNELARTIHICPNKITGKLTWTLWSPEQKKTLSEVGKDTLFTDPPTEGDFIDMPQAAGISLETFYQVYQKPENNGKCMTMTAPDYPTVTP